MQTGTQLTNGCFYGGMMGGWGFGSIYSIIASLLALALLAGIVILVFLLIYDQLKKK